MTDRPTLLATLDSLLEPARYKDYGPNGLQVEGRREIRRLISGVTASRALIEAAIAAGADAILVHHGLFWRGQSGTVTGWMKQRLALLLAHDINLLAYHLPLDAHPELGNNAQLGRVLGLVPTAQRFGEQDLGFMGQPADGVPFASAWSTRRKGPCGVLAGAQAARRATSKPLSPRVSTLSSRARFPSRRPIWRASAAWRSSPAVTMQPSGTARRLSLPGSPPRWASNTSSSISRTPRDVVTTDRHQHGRCRRHRP